MVRFPPTSSVKELLESISLPSIVIVSTTTPAFAVTTPPTASVLAISTAPSMSTTSRLVVPSTSISPLISKEATVAVPVSVGAVNDLFVRVCEPVSVATVLSIAKVTALPEPLVSIPVPPVNVRVSESKSIDNAPPESA